MLTVNDLAERHLLERALDPEDRRRNIITITPEGRRQLADLDRLLAAAQDEFLTPLSSADRQNLIDLLTRLVVGRGLQRVRQEPARVGASTQRP